MRDGFKVFDADAHVVYPPDLWSRFLDKEYRRPGRAAGRSPGFDHYNPVTVDGRYTQHLTSILGQFQKAINWTTDDMIAKYGDIVTEGFTGDRVADAIAIEGVDAMVIYGPEYDMWLEGIDPELQAAMARAYNRWGQEMRETSNGVVITSGPVPLNDVSRAVEEIEYAHEHLGIRCFWARPDQFNHRNLGDRYYDPIYELLQDLDCAFATHEYMGLNAVDRGLRPLQHVHRVAHRRAPARGAERAALDDRARRVRALPASAHRVHGGRLRLAAELAAPHRRAPRARGRGRGAGAHDVGHRLLPAQLLDLHRVRRPLRLRRDPLDGRRPHRLRDRLPAPRLEVPRAPPTTSSALDADLVPDDEQAEGPVGQRGRPVPLPRGLPPAAETRRPLSRSPGRRMSR